MKRIPKLQKKTEQTRTYKKSTNLKCVDCGYTSREVNFSLRFEKKLCVICLEKNIIDNI